MASRLNLYFAALVGMTTAALFGFSVGLIGGIIVLPSFLSHFLLNQLSPSALAAAQSRIVTVWLLGALLGVPLGMPVCSKLGRKACLSLAGLLYLAGAAMQSSGAGLTLFELGRFVNGSGVGVGTLCGPLYISEISPPADRGMLLSGYQTMLQICALIAFWATYVTHAVFGDDSNLQWRIPVVAQLVPGSVLLLGSLLIPETPTFLVRHDRLVDAEKSLLFLRSGSSGEVGQELQHIKSVAAEERRLQNYTKATFLSEAMTPTVRKRLGVGIGLMIAQNMAGMNAINFYGPVIFMSAGFASISSSLFLSGIFGVVKIVAAFAFMFYFVKKRGNLFWLKLGCSICCMSMVALAYLVRDLSKPHTAEDMGNINVKGLAAVVMVLTFTFAFCVSLGPISWNVCAEIFPLSINGQCCALTTMTQWSFQIVIAGITPLLIVSIGWATYALYAAFCLLSLIFVSTCVPETKGVALGKPMDRLFGVEDEDVVDEEDYLDERSALLAHRRDIDRRRSSAAANHM